MPWKISIAPPGGVGGTYTAAVKKPPGFRRMGTIAHASGAIYELEYVPAPGVPASIDVWDLGIILHPGPPTREVTIRTVVAGVVKSTLIAHVTP